MRRPIYKFGSPTLQADDRKPVPVFVTPQAERKSLLDLEANDCRFPFGEGPFEFCGRRKVDGLSYCREHALSCFQPVRLREPSATPFPQATPPSITTAAVLEDV